jgi:hypothetical protein
MQGKQDQDCAFAIHDVSIIYQSQKNKKWQI